MSAAFDRLSGGYYNNNLKTPSNPGGLSGTGAVRANFFPMIADFITVVLEVVASAVTASNSADAAAASAMTAVNAPGTSATSATNTVPIGEGAKTIAIQPGKTLQDGMWLALADQSDGGKWMAGPIAAPNGYDPVSGALTINSVATSGHTNTPAGWNVSLITPMDLTLDGRTTAIETELARLKARHRLLFKETI